MFTIYTSQEPIWPPHSDDCVELIPGNIQHPRSLPGVARIPLHLLYPGAVRDSVCPKVGLSSTVFGKLVLFLSYLVDDHVTALWTWLFILSKVDRCIKYKVLANITNHLCSFQNWWTLFLSSLGSSPSYSYIGIVLTLFVR